VGVLYLTEQGAIVHKNGNRLIVRKLGEEIHSVLAFQVEQVMAFGNIQLTAPAVHYLLQQGIDTVFLSQGGRFRGRLQSFEGKNILLRRAQFRQSEEADFLLKLSQAFAHGKISNCRSLLRRHQQKLQDSLVEQTLVRLKGSLQRLARCKSVDEVRGVEGNAAAMYFDCFRLMLNNPELPFRGRSRRPPRDPPNAALSFCYGMLLGTVTTVLQTVGLDPYLGALHTPDNGKPSLVLDLMEEFRPLLCDSLVVAAINRRQLTADDFRYQETAPLPPGLEGEVELQPDDYPVLLQRESIKKMIMLYENALSRTVTYPRLGNNISYRQVCLEQARLLARHYQGQEEYVAFTPR
jgi:CRISPR-associated protein Cas1